jgi:hypothetical protein
MKFPCPRCNRQMEADSNSVGFTIGCPACKAPVEVPDLRYTLRQPPDTASADMDSRGRHLGKFDLYPLGKAD